MIVIILSEDSHELPNSCQMQCPIAEECFNNPNYAKKLQYVYDLFCYLLIFLHLFSNEQMLSLSSDIYGVKQRDQLTVVLF